MAGRATIELRAGDLAEQDLAVTRLSGREGISEIFAFALEFHRRDQGAVELADLVGAEALVTLKDLAGSERHLHGILWAAELAGVAAGKPHYRALLVPALRRLEHVRRSRVFQGLSAPEIVGKVLDQAGVKRRLALSGTYPKRDLCLQYRESDLAFASRLLEEEGIFWFFEHSASGHLLVLADAPGACVPVAGKAELPFRLQDRGGVHEGEEHLRTLEGVGRLRSGKVLLQDFDFKRPALKVEGSAQAKGASEELEQDRYPGGFDGPAGGARLAKVRLEQARGDALAVAGSGNCLRLFPGAAFEVVEHPVAAMNQKLHVVAQAVEASQVRDAGGAGGAGFDYRCDLEALEASLPIRPARRTPRPTARLETATVVGPSGEEIHTDQHGRVKVRFHWDREGPRDDKASAWLRCAQAWAGAGWGQSVLPRLGQEVLVRFLEGDPDRPLVAGALFNGTHPTPVALPADKTRSTQRSDTSPGGGGYNEIRLEDRAGAEEISVHAQKDETLDVENDKSQQVAGNEALSVAKDRSRSVGGNQALSVAGNDATSVGGAQTLAVAGDRTTAVIAAHAERVALAQAVTVAGNQAVTTALARAETVGAAAALTVGAAYAVTVGAAFNTAVGGLLSRQVAGDHLEAVGAARDESVGGDAAAEVGEDWVEDVAGRVSLSTGKGHAEKLDGKREVEVKEVVHLTAKSFDLKADKLTVTVDGKAVLAIDGSGNVTFGVGKLLVEADGDVKLKGSKINKEAAGSPPSASSSVTKLQPLKGEKAHVEIAVADAAGNPVANEWFQVEFPDGTVKEGRTGGSGKASVPGPKDGQVKVSFPRLDARSWKQK